MFSVRTFQIASFVFVSNSLFFLFIYSRGAYFTWHIPIIWHYHLCKLQTRLWCGVPYYQVVWTKFCIDCGSYCTLYCRALLCYFRFSTSKLFLHFGWSMNCFAMFCFFSLMEWERDSSWTFISYIFFNSLNGSVQEFWENVQRREKLEASYGHFSLGANLSILYVRCRFYHEVHRNGMRWMKSWINHARQLSIKSLFVWLNYCEYYYYYYNYYVRLVHTVSCQPPSPTKSKFSTLEILNINKNQFGNDKNQPYKTINCHFIITSMMRSQKPLCLPLLTYSNLALWWLTGVVIKN